MGYKSLRVLRAEADLVDENIRQAVEYALEQGVIPVIGTKGDRGEGPPREGEGGTGRRPDLRQKPPPSPEEGSLLD